MVTTLTQDTHGNDGKPDGWFRPTRVVQKHNGVSIQLLVADILLLTLAAYVRVHNAARLRRLLVAFVDAVKKRR